MFSIVKKGNEFEIEPEQIYSYKALENKGKPRPYCNTEPAIILQDTYIHIFDHRMSDRKRGALE